jgi:hypothetical protein
VALNPFKQLEFFVPEPKRAFGEIVELILRGGFAAGVRRVGPAEGRLEVVEPPSASRGQQVSLYQAKYFVGRWKRVVLQLLDRAIGACFRYMF